MTDKGKQCKMMTVMLKDERGLTLVEIIIALAISALLLVSVLVGRDGLRSQLQLSQGADQWVQTLSQARTEATNAVGNTNTASGGTSDNFIFGKAVVLTQDSAIAKVQTITYNTVNGVDTFVTNDANDYTVTMPWNVKIPAGYFGVTNAYVIFGQASTSGLPSVWTVITLPAAGQTVAAYTSANPPIAAGGSSAFQVYNSANKSATIHIDSVGNITRTYDP